MDLPILHISFEWDNILCILFFGLTSFTKIHPCWSRNQYLLPYNIPWCGHTVLHLFILKLMNIWFYFLAIKSSTVSTHVWSYVFISLGRTSRRGIAESDDNYILLFEGIGLFPKQLHLLTVLWQCLSTLILQVLPNPCQSPCVCVHVWLLRIKPRALHMLYKPSVAWATCPALSMRAAIPTIQVVCRSLAGQTWLFTFWVLAVCVLMREGKLCRLIVVLLMVESWRENVAPGSLEGG